MALKLRNKRREAGELPLSSTSDIAFLLIIFFVAGAALLELRGVQLALPKKDAPPMQILKKDIFKVEVSKEGIYESEGKAYQLPALEILVRAELEKNKDMVLVVRVDENAPSESVPILIRSMQLAGVTRLSLGLAKK